MKPHYPILDGLRGVAALMVVAFHVCEASATGHLDQLINHGYLAVDFFFLLSGFVVGYAYDDRWHTMTLGNFFTRRLVRLQPMVVMGMVVGAALFYFQDSVLFPTIHEVPVGKVLLVMLIGCTMLPLPISMDIRGWQEMYPLNGPAWSLFFEYIANILYALVLRRLSNWMLGLLVVLAAGFLFHLAVFGPTGDVIGGWSLDPTQLHIGFARVLYPFLAGLLLCRLAKLRYVPNAFAWCSLLVVVVLAMPRIGGERLWMNGIYDALSILLVFPLIVYLGAGGRAGSGFAAKLCRFFGDISYPIYITHYPIIYIYSGWVIGNQVPFEKAWPVGLLVLASSIALAYACFRLYDLPVRAWLQRKLLREKASA